MHANSTQRRRRKLSRRVLVASLLSLAFSALVLIALGSTASSEEGLRIGSTTYSVEFESDETQDEWLDVDSSETAHSRSRRIGILFPFGLLTIEADYEPAEALRKNLPRDVPSLTKRLTSRNRFEVKVAAELLAEKEANALSALPALFEAWARDLDLDLGNEIRTIALAAAEQSVPSLIEGLSTPISAIQVHCASILGSLGTNAHPAGPALKSAFQKNNVGRAEFASAYLEVTGDCSDMLPELRQILKTGEWRDQYVTLGILERMERGGAAALPEVLELLQKKHGYDLNGLALIALSEICNDHQLVLNHITQALNETNEMVVGIAPHSAAFHALANLGELGLPHLIEHYQSGSERLYETTQALVVLGPIAAPHIELFRKDLHSTDPQRARAACEILASLGTNAIPAIPEIKALLHSSDPLTRARSAAAILSLGSYDEAAIKTLVEELSVSQLFFEYFGARTLVGLLATNDHARAFVSTNVLQNPQLRRRFSAQLNRWSEFYMEGFSSRDPFTIHLKSPALAQFRSLHQN